MNKSVAILQSDYIPWKGYFDIINMVDLFVFYDDIQYTKNDWRNRNKIKTSDGTSWLTIPCGHSEKRLICEVELNDKFWQKKHWASISQHYHKAKYFDYYKSFFEDFYLGKKWNNLSEMNQYLIKHISSEFLMSATRFDDSRNFDLQQRKKEERLLELLAQTDATHYLSGPTAKEYICPENFQKAGILLEWMDYSNYPEYCQLYPPFEHRVSIVDLIFNEGPNAPTYIKSFDSQNRKTEALMRQRVPPQ